MLTRRPEPVVYLEEDNYHDRWGWFCMRCPVTREGYANQDNARAAAKDHVRGVHDS